MKKEVVKKNTDDLALLTEVQVELREPALYQVYLHDDDYTPMEFVVTVLEQFFLMDRQKATAVMYEAHTKGKAACGVFSKDIAETKIEKVLHFSQQNEHPLICSMEAAT